MRRVFFRFGNGDCLEASESVLIPVQFGSRNVVIRAAILAGNGANSPLLLSKKFLRQLETQMDLSQNRVIFKKLGVSLEMGTTKRGHCAVNLFGDGWHAQDTHDTQRTQNAESEAFETQAVSSQPVDHATSCSTRRRPTQHRP